MPRFESAVKPVGQIHGSTSGTLVNVADFMEIARKDYRVFPVFDGEGGIRTFEVSMYFDELRSYRAQIMSTGFQKRAEE
jgi:hypothetical protein